MGLVHPSCQTTADPEALASLVGPIRPFALRHACASVDESLRSEPQLPATEPERSTTSYRVDPPAGCRWRDHRCAGQAQPSATKLALGTLSAQGAWPEAQVAHHSVPRPPFDQ